METRSSSGGAEERSAEEVAQKEVVLRESIDHEAKMRHEIATLTGQACSPLDVHH
jgi:hypothetical protein